jgi:hypothetical protein
MAKGKKTGGRKKGTPNKLTAENRQFFKDLFARVGPELEDWIRDTAKKDKARAAELVMKAAEFYVAKLQRLTIDLAKVPIEDIAAELQRRLAGVGEDVA